MREWDNEIMKEGISGMRQWGNERGNERGN